MGIYENINNFSLNFIDGVDNQSGIQEEAYFIPLSWLKTIAKPMAGTTAASLLEISDHHVMATGKKPIPMAPLYKKSGLKSSLEGEELSKMFKQGPAEFFIPQVVAENLGTVAAIRNYRGLVLMKRPGNDSEFIQIGSQGLAAYLTSAEIDLGTGPTGSVGIKVTFEAYGAVPCYIYKGRLPAEAPAGTSKGAVG